MPFGYYCYFLQLFDPDKPESRNTKFKNLNSIFSNHDLNFHIFLITLWRSVNDNTRKSAKSHHDDILS